MKIDQLPQSARFEYEGEEYIKSGPLFRSSKAGQRLIARYAVLKPLDVVVSASTKRDDPLLRAVVLAAFDCFFRDSPLLVPADKQSVLEAGREHFLKKLAK